MKKKLNMGMIIVLSMSAVSSAKIASAKTDYVDSRENAKIPESDNPNNTINADNGSEESETYEDNDNNTEVKVTTLSKSGKINSGKIITEKIYEKEMDKTISSSAIGNGSVDFNLKFKKSDSKEDFSAANFTNVTNVNTSGAAIDFTSYKIPYIGFDVSLGDIIIKKAVSGGIVVEQNGKETYINDGIKMMLFGSTYQYGICVGENIDLEIILNGVSVSSDKGINIGGNSDVDFKIIDNSLNTIKNFVNNGKADIYGETGALTVREFNGKVGIFGGIVKATEECGSLSEIVVKNCSADIKTSQTVKSSIYGNEKLVCNLIKVDGINSSETVEVNVNGESFITKTDVGGKLYLFLPNRDNKVIVKNKDTAFIANIKENGGGNYTAEEISAINRVDVEVFQNLNKDGFTDVSFKVKIPDNMKYSDDLKIGVQCFESGWLTDDKISDKDIAKRVNDEDGEYYYIIIENLENNKNYKCRVFSVCDDEVNFSDVMEFKTKCAEEEKFDELKVSGLSKVYNTEGQGIDVVSEADFKVIYYNNGNEMEGLPVNAGKYTAKVIVNDKEHEYFEKNFEFTIEQANPLVLKTPYATNVIVGEKISASRLFGGEAEGNGKTLNGNFKWKNGDEVVEKSGEYIAQFIPDDKNYSIIEYKVSVITDDEKHIEFIYDIEKEYTAEKGGIIILKTEAAANDGAAVIYQWYKDNEAIDGAVSGILVRDNLSESDEGEYFVIASSLDGYSAQSGKCIINIIEKEDEGENDNASYDKIGGKVSSGSVKKSSSVVIFQKAGNSETESKTESTTDAFYESETSTEEKKKKKSLISLGFDDEDNDEESSEENETETSSESNSKKSLIMLGKNGGKTETEDEKDEGISGSLEIIKRITDDMLIEIYGKVTYPDNDTVAATTVYKGPSASQKKIVFQLNENGFFTEVDKYSFSGNEVSVLTDRDYPLIVGKTASYSDIKYHWDSDDILFVSAFDIMSGQGSNFNPEKNVTRGDFIDALYNLAGKPEYVETQNYSDVPQENKYYDAINWAYEQGFIKGRSDTEFGIDLNVTREQAAVVLSKYIERMGFSLSDSAKSYSDAENISDWALSDVYKVSDAGIMGDLGYGRFQPKAFCSRADVATLIKKVIQYKIQY